MTNAAADPWRVTLNAVDNQANPTRELVAPCRCGSVDESPMGSTPVRVPLVYLAGRRGQIALETIPAARICAACTHTIPASTAAVVHRLSPAAGVFNRFHPECVDF